MSKIQLYVPLDVAHSTIDALAPMNRIQFLDLNPDTNPFQRTFVAELRRLDECERKLIYLTDKMDSEGIHAKPFAETKGWLYSRSKQQLVDELEVKLNESEDRLVQMSDSYDTLLKRNAELQEAKHVLIETAAFFRQARPSHPGRTSTEFSIGDSDEAPLLENAMEQGGASANQDAASFELEFVAGTIDRARMPTFERILWRVLRGNLYMNWAEIQEPLIDPAKPNQPKSEGVRKAVFIIFAHGSELLDKIKRISESLGATLYPVDASPDKRNLALQQVTSRIEDLSSVLHNTSVTRKTELVRLADSISAWWGLIRMEKIVYHTLNLFAFDSGRRTLVAEGWVPTRDIGAIQQVLRQASESSIPPILHELRNASDPPTFHRTNKFTAGFQAIIDAYGIASYQEINPGLFTVITFPFLFAVMFGDIGHGFLMALSALGFIMVEKKFPRGFGEEITDTFFFGRYIILLMGIFAMYTGLIYNDIFSLNLRLFKSGWSFPEPQGNSSSPLDAVSTGTVYALGLDPAWHGADNALIFTNSLKMKMSIIFGVIHMSFAICLNVPNHLHFKNKRFIIAEWLPQILFMECLFGYLMFMIIYKWSIDWSRSAIPPPNLLNTLIFMVLSPGTVDNDHQNVLYRGQAFIQAVLLLVAFVCVPWMLCAKPYLLWRDHQTIVKQGYDTLGGSSTRDAIEDAEDANGNGMEMDHEGDHQKEHFDFGEIAIHQIIHTIEFCLGCISNTASYLRLWALSLAHAQLSEVLWTMTIKRTFGMTGITGIVAVTLGFGFWFILTIGILCVMEGLSAFLHALRLHWVESNGKHYEGAGTLFAPLTFDGIDEGF